MSGCYVSVSETLSAFPSWLPQPKPPSITWKLLEQEAGNGGTGTFPHAALAFYQGGKSLSEEPREFLLHLIDKNEVSWNPYDSPGKGKWGSHEPISVEPVFISEN